MKVVTDVPGHDGKWLIDLEFSPWSPKKFYLRDEGMSGKLIRFDTEAEGEAKLKELLAGGEQAAIFKYGPPPPLSPAPEHHKPGKHEK
jgi:hypothetical protein